MTKDTFHQLWILYTPLWLKTKINDGYYANDLCFFRSDAENLVHDNYLILKDYVKEMYFIDNTGEVVLNRYKRAAVMAYTIIKIDPLIMREGNTDPVDRYYLKQRFALFFSIISILTDYKESAVKEKHIFQSLETIGKDTSNCGNDTFLMSIYKDFLYAELYQNFDILGTANMFGLLFEYALGFTKDDLIDN